MDGCVCVSGRREGGWEGGGDHWDDGLLPQQKPLQLKDEIVGLFVGLYLQDLLADRGVGVDQCEDRVHEARHVVLDSRQPNK